MKKLNVILLLLLTIVLSACDQKYSGKTPPKAKNGVIDLSGWDFEKEGPIKLDGEWGFFWKKLIDPKEFAANPEKYVTQQKHITVPGIWSSFKDENGKEIEGKGNATYLLRIKRDTIQKDSELAFSLFWARTSYHIYLISFHDNEPQKKNNSGISHHIELKLILKNGVVASNKKESIPQYLPVVKRLSLWV